MGQTICDNEWCTTTIFFILNHINTLATFGAGATCNVIERFKTEQHERTYKLNNVIANIDYSGGNKVIVFKDKDNILLEDSSKILNQIIYDNIRQAMIYNVIRNLYAAKFCFDDGEIELQI
jgi:hypothetical protein